jgi:hypothetical protein
MLGARFIVPAAASVLVASCIGIAAVPNLAESPGTFLALFGLAFVAYAVGLFALSALPDSRAFVLALIVAAVCRLALLPAPPTLSTDAYRYVWDARVAAAGISPYAHPPAAPEVAGVRDATIHPRLNHPTWLTIYPPAAQVFFRAVYALAPDSILAMKVALGTTEVVGLALLVFLLRALGLPVARLAIYAWNPLVLVEVWGSAHLDALAVAAVIAAMLAAVKYRHGLAGVMLALGTLVKLYPAALLPLLVRSGGRRVLVAFAIVFVLGYGPFVGMGIQALGSLPRYVFEEYFNPGLVRSIVDRPAASLLAMAAWIGGVAWWSRPVSVVSRVVPTIAGFVLLSPNVFPWYVVWLVPFLAVTPSVWWIAFTGTVTFAYAFFLYQPWMIPMWARLLEIAPLVIGVGWWVATRISQPRDVGAASGVTIAKTPGPLRGRGDREWS